MCRNLLEADIMESIMNLPRNTSPGIDGFTPEFYIHFRNLIAPDIAEVFNSSGSANKKCPPNWTKIALKMIPKTGNLNLLRNWRPVSLCCVDYKIVTKSLSNRINQIIATIVSAEQSICIPTRCIHRGKVFIPQ